MSRMGLGCVKTVLGGTRPGQAPGVQLDRGYQRIAVRERDLYAGVVLHEARHLTFAIDRHLELVDPAGEDALDVGSVVAPARMDAALESR